MSKTWASFNQTPFSSLPYSSACCHLNGFFSWLLLSWWQQPKGPGAVCTVHQLLPCRIGPSIRTTKAVRTERYGWMLIVSSAVEDLGDSGWGPWAADCRSCKETKSLCTSWRHMRLVMISAFFDSCETIAGHFFIVFFFCKCSMKCSFWSWWAATASLQRKPVVATKCWSEMFLVIF